MERLIPLFEARGDELGMAKARRRLAIVYRTRRDIRSMEAELERAIVHARAAGDTREEARSLGLMATAALLGPTPAADGIARCERLRAEAPGNRIVERAVLPALAGLSAMTGDFDGARQRLVEHGRLCDELGLRLDAAEGAIVAGWVELLGREPAAAEAALAAAVTDLQAMGERSNLGMAAALLGQARYHLGRQPEAIAATKVAESAAAPDDLGTQIAWRIARSCATVASGDVTEGRRLADEAARLAGQTDSLELRGQAQAALAAADLARGETALARAAFEKAVTAFERKGDVVSVAAARAQLEMLDGLSAGATT